MERDFREELLNPLNKPKTYVTYLPYLEGEKKRYKANIFTTLDYKEKDIVEQEDTEGAIEFVESFSIALLDASAGLKMTIGDESSTEREVRLSLDLGYFIDSRHRTDKSFKDSVDLEDFIIGLHTVTIGGSYKDSKGSVRSVKKTFVVNLESFLQALNAKGFSTSLYTSSYSLIKTIVEVGLDASPRLEIIGSEEVLNKNGAKSLT